MLVLPMTVDHLDAFAACMFVLPYGVATGTAACQHRTRTALISDIESSACGSKYTSADGANIHTPHPRVLMFHHQLIQGQASILD